MPIRSGSLKSGTGERCAVCNGKFGLVRHYSWRTSLCSKQCVERLRARRASDHSWLRWPELSLVQTLENRVRAL
jgi:hypothetical protein